MKKAIALLLITTSIFANQIEDIKAKENIKPYLKNNDFTKILSDRYFIQKENTFYKLLTNDKGVIISIIKEKRFKNDSNFEKCKSELKKEINKVVLENDLFKEYLKYKSFSDIKEKGLTFTINCEKPMDDKNWPFKVENEKDESALKVSIEFNEELNKYKEEKKDTLKEILLVEKDEISRIKGEKTNTKIKLIKDIQKNDKVFGLTFEKYPKNINVKNKIDYFDEYKIIKDKSNSLKINEPILIIGTEIQKPKLTAKDRIIEIQAIKNIKDLTSCKKEVEEINKGIIDFYRTDFYNKENEFPIKYDLFPKNKKGFLMEFLDTNKIDLIIYASCKKTKLILSFKNVIFGKKEAINKKIEKAKKQQNIETLRKGYIDMLNGYKEELIYIQKRRDL